MIHLGYLLLIPIIIETKPPTELVSSYSATLTQEKQHLSTSVFSRKQDDINNEVLAQT